MRTVEKYKEMGFVELSATKVQDKYGKIFHPRKDKKPLRAIRLFCAECMGMDRSDKKAPFPYDDIRNCTDPMCPLFDFRLGKNPFMKRELTEEQLKEARERMKFVRNADKDTGKK